MEQKKYKNIVIVAHYFFPHTGGIESVARDQARRLAKLGNKVAVITSKINPEEKNGFFDGVEICRVRALNYLEKWGVPFPIFSPRLISVLMKFIKNSDIVHVHDAFYLSSFFAVLCARWYKKPIVLTQHVAMVPHPNKIIMAVQEFVYSTTGAIVFRLSSKIITLNDRVEKFLIKKRVPPHKILALPNGVDINFYQPVDRQRKMAIRKKFNLSLNKRIVLFVGRFVPKKGFHKVLAARCNEYQIVMVGGDIPGKSDSSVIFFKKLPPETLKLIYQASDLFVLPSEGEGFPLTIQEAMASGLPIISGSDDGYRRYDFDKKRMCFIDNPTDQSVREAIKTIINNDIMLKDMSEYSKHYATAYFSWPKIILRLDGIYNNLLAL